MTDIEYQGKKVVKIQIRRLCENYVYLHLTTEDGKVVDVGSFKEET